VTGTLSEAFRADDEVLPATGSGWRNIASGSNQTLGSRNHGRSI